MTGGVDEMADETLRSARERQRAGAAAAAAAQSHADDHADEIARRVRAITADFLAEIAQLGNLGVRALDNGQRGWVLAEYAPPGYDVVSHEGIALALDGTWLRIWNPWVEIDNPATCFVYGQLFGAGRTGVRDVLADLAGGHKQELTLAMNPLDRTTVPPQPLLLYDIDEAILQSPAALAAHCFAALLARLAAETPRPAM